MVYEFPCQKSYLTFIGTLTSKYSVLTTSHSIILEGINYNMFKRQHDFVKDNLIYLCGYVTLISKLPLLSASRSKVIFWFFFCQLLMFMLPFYHSVTLSSPCIDKQRISLTIFSCDLYCFVLCAYHCD